MTKYLSAANPRGGPAASFESATPAWVAARAAELKTAQSAWADSGAAHRAAVLKQWHEALCAARASIIDALAEDTGRVRLAYAEFDGAVQRILHWAERAPGLMARAVAEPGYSAAMPSVRYEHCLRPLGLVGVVGPWNFPLLLTLIDAMPALAAGCSVLAKPSEVTPRFIAPLESTLAAVPELDAVLRFARGGADVGTALVAQVDAICFTGSVATGARVGAHAGSRLIPAFLELGGKDPLIVLQDAELDAAVEVTLRTAVVATGQACQSIERIYVHEALMDAFVDRLIEAARAVTLNTERIDCGHLGPFIDPRQAGKVEAQIAQAEAAGAVRRCGGIVRRGGAAWCRPVVLTGLSHDMLLYKEETFGPVLPVMPFRDDDEAVALANDSAFGLSAAVLGDERHACRVARRLNVGAVSVNDGGLTAGVSDVEKESFGVSGVGRSRMGDSGLLRFLRRQALLVQTGAAAPLDAYREEGA